MNDDPSRRDEAFDQLVAATDPGREALPLDRLQSDWNALARRRSIRRRCVKGVAALIVLGFGVGLFLRSHQEDRFAADPATEIGRDNPDQEGPPNDQQNAAPSRQLQPNAPNTDRIAPNSADPKPSTTPAPDRPQSDETDKLSPRDRRLAKREEEVNALLAKAAAVEPRSIAWRQLVLSLRRAEPVAQQRILERIAAGEVTDRGKTMQLVIHASSGWGDPILRSWLRDGELRADAWPLLLARLSNEELDTAVQLAASEAERQDVLNRVLALPGAEAADWLVELSVDGRWRFPISVAATKLNEPSRGRLIQLLRHGSPHQRAAAGFLIACLPDPGLDEEMISKVLGGRDQQTAYLVLMARRTETANRFLQRARQHRDLAPALVSAQFGWYSFGPITSQWLSEIEEKKDEQDSARADDDPAMRVAIHGDRSECDQPG